MISWILNFLNNKKLCPFFFITPTPYAIGTASEEILLAASKAVKENKILIILYVDFFTKFLRYFICNKYLFNNLILKNYKNKKYIFIKYLIKFFLEIEFLFQRTFVILSDDFLKIKFKASMRFLNIGIDQIYETEKVNLKNLTEKKYSEIPKFYFNCKIFDIEKKLKEKGQIILNKIGFDDNKKIVCVHVRDNKFRKDRGIKDYRNSNIDNYREGINYLIERGYQVIRLGRSPCRKINFKNKYFFDYATSHIQSDEMDLYLIKKCKFYIGTQSGILDLANIFNKPTLTTNMVEMFNSFPRKIVDRGIFKKIFKNNGKKIPLMSYNQFPYSKYHIPQYKVKDLIFKENSPSEILESIIEFEHNLNKAKFTNLQKKFNKYLNNSFERLVNNNIKSKEILKNEYPLQQIRTFKSAKGSLCHFYLKKNFII